ncbi:hypothetical protein BDW69DRAFT_183810 [Aspergillus filifer]
MENGLCKNVPSTTDDNDQGFLLRRTGGNLCSDPDWPSESCLDVCSGGDYAGNTAQVTPFDGTDNSTEWCCGTSTDCCGTNSAMTIAPVLAALSFSTASATSSSITSTQASSPTPNADDTSSTSYSPSQTTTFSSSSGLSTGAKAGIGASRRGCSWHNCRSRVSLPPSAPGSEYGTVAISEWSSPSMVKVAPGHTWGIYESAPAPAYVAEMRGNSAVHEICGGARGDGMYGMDGEAVMRR